MLRKAMFGMMAMIGLIAISGGTASAYGYNGHNHNWNNHGYRTGWNYGRYAPRVVVNPPVYTNGCGVTPGYGGYGYGGYGYGGYGGGGYGYGAPGVSVNTPGFGFYAR